MEAPAEVCKLMRKVSNTFELQKPAVQQFAVSANLHELRPKVSHPNLWQKQKKKLRDKTIPSLAYT